MVARVAARLPRPVVSARSITVGLALVIIWKTSRRLDALAASPIPTATAL
jgi:hypothetical protein